MQQKYGTPLRLLRWQDIVAAVQDNYLRIEPFAIDNVQPTGYDISISRIVKYPQKEIYCSEDVDNIVEDFDEVTLSPGHSVLFLTHEYLTFPHDMIAEICLRSRYSRIFNSGEYMGRVECGWNGHLVLEVSNRSSDRRVLLKRNETVATLVIYQLKYPPSRAYAGRYQNWFTKEG